MDLDKDVLIGCKNKFDESENTKDCIKYDVGLVCMMNLNIGNNLTNYALYQYLDDLNYDVLLIGNPLVGTVEFPDTLDGRLKLFLQSPYPMSNVFEPPKNKWELSSTNQICDKFVLGSDQLWRDIFINIMDYFTCLDWVESSKYKIAYGTSFGISNLEGNVNMRKKMGYLLKRFQNISVREQDGVKILRELYGIEAECVLDPVFLCKREYYENMAEKGQERLPDGKYVAGYLLDITNEKEKAVLNIADLATSGVYMAITEPCAIVRLNSKLRFTEDPFNEEWLAMIQNCDFFLTDSFHGMCFALIFQKQFCVIFNKENWRGMSRIHSLLDLLQLNSRLIENYECEKVLSLYNHPIDYERVNKILYTECERSKDWLKTALEKGEHYRGTYDTHDFAWSLVNYLQQTLREEARISNYKTRNDLFITARSIANNSVGEQKRKPETMQIVGWGAGDCFRRNIYYIKSFYDMKYVCDKDPEKWGKELEEDVICISPKMLQEMGNVMVIIMVDRAGISFQIAKELSELGITNYEHVENWLAFIEGR